MTKPLAIQRAIDQASDKTEIRPFHVDVPEADLADLSCSEARRTRRFRISQVSREIAPLTWDK